MLLPQKTTLLRRAACALLILSPAVAFSAPAAVRTRGSVTLLSAAPGQTKVVRGTSAPANAIWLDSLDTSAMSQGWGRPVKRRSVTGAPITLRGVAYPRGIGTHAESDWEIDLKGSAVRFVSAVGLDDARIGSGSIVFAVYVDGKLAAKTPVRRGGDEPMLLSVDLTGAKRLLLVVEDAGDGVTNDHADWVGALLYLAAGAKNRPQAVTLARVPPPVIASADPNRTAIHGPRVVGATPGRPFLFRIPATGKSPLSFSARWLPAALRLDRKTGIVTGSIAKSGTFRVGLTVRGPGGIARRDLTLLAGRGKLARTPPMGWNSWYAWFGVVDDAKMRQAADFMVKSGLAAHGYQYVAIDDCWEGERRPDGTIRTNARFPDMKKLAGYIHSKGLKFGIYSSPGPRTCAGYLGSYGHEERDARTYAEWGVDLLKYDWCSYGEVVRSNRLEELQRPYRVMSRAIERTGRDIVYSLCQYGMGDVWKWGADVGGHFWRTTGDSGDSWSVVSSIGFRQDGLERYAGPGRWNDPDMLQVGHLGGSSLRRTGLTPHEQVTQMTLWSLIAAPLLLSCDLSRLDRFTTDLLTNDEVIDIDQDPLGKAAGCRVRNGLTEIWTRPLFDGTTAIGVFNRGRSDAPVTVRWRDLGLKGPLSVRDLWRRTNVGRFRDSFTTTVRGHGAMLYKAGRRIG